MPMTIQEGRHKPGAHSDVWDRKKIQRFCSNWTFWPMFTKWFATGERKKREKKKKKTEIRESINASLHFKPWFLQNWFPNCSYFSRSLRKLVSSLMSAWTVFTALEKDNLWWNNRTQRISKIRARQFWSLNYALVSPLRESQNHRERRESIFYYSFHLKSMG